MPLPNPPHRENPRPRAGQAPPLRRPGIPRTTSSRQLPQGEAQRETPPLPVPRAGQAALPLPRSDTPRSSEEARCTSAPSFFLFPVEGQAFAGGPVRHALRPPLCHSETSPQTGRGNPSLPAGMRDRGGASPARTRGESVRPREGQDPPLRRSRIIRSAPLPPAQRSQGGQPLSSMLWMMGSSGSCSMAPAPFREVLFNRTTFSKKKCRLRPPLQEFGLSLPHFPRFVKRKVRFNLTIFYSSGIL